ncbi:MAG: hypothetical protein ACSHX7_00755 [Luteolibacter sp.]
MRWSLLSFLLFLPLSGLLAEETPPKTTPEAISEEEKLATLRVIAKPLTDALADLIVLQRERDSAPSEDTREQIIKRIDDQKLRIEQLRENFRNVVGGAEAAEYDDIITENKSFQEQITELLQPVLSGWREATAEPRQLESLRNSLALWQKRERNSQKVLKSIDDLINTTENPVIEEELNSTRRIWEGRQSEATSKIAVTNIKIAEHTKDKRPIWEKMSDGFSAFFKSRGMNLLYAILAAATGFFATRKIYALIRRISPAHKKSTKNFTSRISDLIALFLSILVALLGIILVFYLRGDWLLLTLVIIFLIGVAWAGKTAIPPYLEQIRMILNLGSVREDERVIYEGLPWKVSRLGFNTTFTNPNLQGGLLRIPIRNVMDMISRPLAKKENWFPTEVDDWMVLSDDTFGKTIIQTPDQVVVLELGGSLKTYPTADFLALAPRNLSHGFRVAVTFGIDYKHQVDCTTTIPEIFKNALTSSLISTYGRDAVRSIQVEFQSAAASSLDYVVLADFAGSTAQRFNPIKRNIQKVCVDVCNEHGWIIPFTQITVHRAELEETAAVSIPAE